jgi:multiple antibiotic resistance protein
VSLIYDLIGYVFLVIAALIPIANPFSTAPVFMTLTSSLSRQERNRTATLACTYMGLLLILFLVAGAVILQFFGIGSQALRVAGGLIIAYMGFRMLFPADQSEEVGDTSKITPHSVAFVPLALPMLSGPGSISVVLSMATEVAKLEDIFERLIAYAVVGLGIVLSAATCWLVLRSAGVVVRFLGETGIDALTRIMGFLLVCIGCQFVLSSFQG